MIKEYNFLFQGNNDIYHIVCIHHDDGRVTINCNCPAGENSMLCRHRREIINGDDKNIIGNNKNECRDIAYIIEGTKTEQALHYLETCENEYEESKQKLAKAKRAFGRILGSGE